MLQIGTRPAALVCSNVERLRSLCLLQQGLEELEGRSDEAHGVEGGGLQRDGLAIHQSEAALAVTARGTVSSSAVHTVQPLLSGEVVLPASL